MKRVMGSRGSGYVWIENTDRTAKSFHGSVQLFLDRTATTLKRTVLVAYTVQAISLNVTAGIKQWLVDNLHTLVGFPSVCRIQEPLEGEKGVEDEEITMY